MILHVVRHGQVLPSSHPHAPPCPHPGDTIITDLGRRQAHRAGEKLHEIGFAGAIYTSPYRRAVGTAAGIAEATGSPVVPVGDLREMVMHEGQMDDFCGASAEVLGREFSHIAQAPPADPLPDVWWSVDLEAPEEVVDRVRPFIDRVIARGEDAAIVGHGATVNGTLTAVLSQYDPNSVDLHRGNWNASISSLALAPTYKPIRMNDISHLSDDEVTSNADRPDAAALAEARA